MGLRIQREIAHHHNPVDDTIPSRIATNRIVHAGVDLDGVNVIGTEDGGSDAEDAGAAAEVEHAIDTASLTDPSGDRGQAELRGLVQPGAKPGAGLDEDRAAVNPRARLTIIP